MSLDLSSCLRAGLRGRSAGSGYEDAGALGEAAYLIECLIEGEEYSREWARAELLKVAAEGRAALEGEGGR